MLLKRRESNEYTTARTGRRGTGRGDALWGEVRRQPKRMEEMQKELDRLSQCPRCSEGNRRTNPWKHIMRGGEAMKMMLVLSVEVLAMVATLSWLLWTVFDVLVHA